MVRGLNKVMIIGQLGRDPEMRFTGSGQPVTTFNVKTTRGSTNDQGERQEESEWFHVVAWGNLAEICKKHLYEDASVYVEGHLQTRSWDNAEGQRHYRTELVAKEVIFLDEQHGHS